MSIAKNGAIRDDITGKMGAESHVITIDGKKVILDTNVDLSTLTIGEVLSKGRVPKAGRPRKNRGGASVRNDCPNLEIRSIRQWAQSQGFEVGTRGKIAENIKASYYSAQ